MKTGTIIKALNIAKYRLPGMSRGSKRLVVQTLDFQGSKETFCHSIVITVARTAHAGHQVVLCQQCSIGKTGILTPLVRMMEQAYWRAACQERSLQRPLDQFCGHGGIHGPAHNLARVEVK